MHQQIKIKKKSLKPLKLDRSNEFLPRCHKCSSTLFQETINHKVSEHRLKRVKVEVPAWMDVLYEIRCPAHVVEVMAASWIVLNTSSKVCVVDEAGFQEAGN